MNKLVVLNFTMLVAELITINVRTKLEMFSCICSKDMTGAPKFRNGPGDPDNANLGDS